MINNKKLNGFTLIELIFVIIILGVMAAVAIGSVKNNIREDAINNVLAAVRYTQHLALADNKMDPNISNWQKSLWTLEYAKCNGKYQYTIGSDMNLNGKINETESAMSVIDDKLIYNNISNCKSNQSSDNISIGKNFYITDIKFKDCGANNISFDYLGRPHSNVNKILTSNYSSLNKKDCIITYSFDTSLSFQPIVLTINSETGYASINNREGL